MSNHSSPASWPWRTVAQAAAISFTVVLAAGAPIASSGLFADDPVPAMATLDANTSAWVPTAPRTSPTVPSRRRSSPGGVSLDGPGADGVRIPTRRPARPVAPRSRSHRSWTAR